MNFSVSSLAFACAVYFILYFVVTTFAQLCAYKLDKAVGIPHYNMLYTYPQLLFRRVVLMLSNKGFNLECKEHDLQGARNLFPGLMVEETKGLIYQQADNYDLQILGTVNST